MHDGLQIGTLAAILFGIMLNRYDVAALRKEMRADMAELRKEMREGMAALRADVHRSTSMLTELLFQHAERITKLESKQ